MKKILLILLLLILPLSAIAKDRCQDYLPDIRSYGIQYNGADYPWWYNVGCAITETSCRGDLISFDGGIGLFQLTPSTGIVAELSKYITVDPYDVQSNIRAQSYYIMLVRTKKFTIKSATVGKSKNPVHPATFVNKCGMNLADVYRFYNGGFWFFYESERGKFVCDNKEMKKYCVRGGTWTDKAKTKWLSFCDVNYSYPEKVYNYSQKYRIGADGQRYWYVKQLPIKEEKPIEVREAENEYVIDYFNFIGPIIDPLHYLLRKTSTLGTSMVL